MGHVESYCEKLFTLEKDDGYRGWGPELRAEPRRPANGGGGRWLRDEGQHSWSVPNQGWTGNQADKLPILDERN
ncbi:hypothetical protein SESBI_05193 [Sesbania bispinosa]|nr:hypothetical protein SESBI_05193 [Sesbania bispinosa]